MRTGNNLMASAAPAVRRGWAAWAVGGVALLLIAAAWLVAGAYLRQAQADAEAVAESERRNVALALVSQVDATITQVDSALLTMRRFWRDGGPEAFRREDLARAESMRYSAVFEQVVVFGPDGRILYTTPRGFLDEAINVADVEHFSVHRRDPAVDALFIGRPFFGRVAKRWHVQMTRPIIDRDGRFAGVIAASVRPERFALLHREISLGANGIIAIIRDTGEYVARTERLDEVMGMPVEPVPPLAANAPNFGEFRLKPRLDGVERAYTWRKVPDSPLILLVGQRVDGILGAVRGLRGRVYGWLGGFTVLSLGLLAALTHAARQKSRAQAALAENEARLSLFYAMPFIGMVMIRPDLHWEAFNDRWCDILGYSRDELWRLTWPELTHPDDMARNADVIAGVQAGRVNDYELEKRYIRKDGGVVTCLLKVHVMRDAHGAVERYVAMVLDVTEARRIEAALRDSEQRFRGMFEKTNAGIAFCTPDRRLLDVNEAFQRLLGYSRDELLGMDFCNFTMPEDMAREEPLFAELLDGRRSEYRMEKRYRARDDRVIWVDLSATVIRNAGGGVAYLVGAVYDITERKLNEIALAASNAELEQFGYVASHDLRQPLRMISSYLKLLERDLGDNLSSDQREFLGYARDGALRMDQMLMSLLEYSRVGRRGEPMARHSSRILLEEAMLFVTPDIDLSGAVVRIRGDWPEITASRNEMVRLFQNLLSNALKYRPAGHAPQVEATVEPHGDEWLFSVTDDGIGIDPDQIDRLFRVFQRLTGHGEYDGAGVGLAVCRKIVERHGGRIWAESAGLGQGAAFRFTLPAQGGLERGAS